MSWKFVTSDLPKVGDPILGAWRVNEDYPGSVNGWSFEVAIWNGLDWIDSDHECRLTEPMRWREIEYPDQPGEKHG